MPDQDFKHPSEKTFSELLAETAKDQRDSLILGIIRQAKEGDASALKLIAQAMEEQRFTEETKFVVSDERFKEIILFAADRIRGEQAGGNEAA